MRENIRRENMNISCSEYIENDLAFRRRGMLIY